jgi:predicted DNA-binding transcriptional regulator AlpA
MTAYIMPREGFVRVNNIAKVTGLSVSTIWRKTKAGTFPRSYKISEMITAWSCAEVWAWIQDRLSSPPPPSSSMNNHTDYFNELSFLMVGSPMLSKRSLLLMKTNKFNELPLESGVYFLIDGDNLIYVGQSEKIKSRVFSRDHLEDESKKYNSFSYILCGKHQLNALESIYIHTFNLPRNRTVDGKRVYAPLSIERLLSLSITELKALKPIGL